MLTESRHTPRAGCHTLGKYVLPCGGLRVEFFSSMKTLLPLAILGCLCFTAAAQQVSGALQIQLPSGPLLDGKLEVIDASSGQWKGMKAQFSRSDESGFTGFFSTPSGGQTVLEGKFEKSGESLQCSITWNGTEQFPESFMMLVLLLPADSWKECVFQSGESQISLGKLYEGVPSLNSFNDVQSFAMGPIDGKTMNVTADMPVSVEVKKFDEQFHVRLSLTPRKASFPASGSVAWTITAQ